MSEYSTLPKELYTALIKAQKDIKIAVMDSYNPHYKSKFASLTAVQASYKEALIKNELFLMQFVTSEGQEYFLETKLVHSSGQSTSFSFKLIISKNDMQGLGAAITYAKRYAASALLNIVDTEDLDGEDAVNRGSPKEPIKNYAPSSSSDPGYYIIPFGKFKDRVFSEIDLDELANYVAYVESESKKSLKPINKQVSEFLRRATQWIEERSS